MKAPWPESDQTRHLIQLLDDSFGSKHTAQVSKIGSSSFNGGAPQETEWETHLALFGLPWLSFICFLSSNSELSLQLCELATKFTLHWNWNPNFSTEVTPSIPSEMVKTSCLTLSPRQFAFGNAEASVRSRAPTPWQRWWGRCPGHWIRSTPILECFNTQVLEVWSGAETCAYAIIKQRYVVYIYIYMYIYIYILYVYVLSDI